jgi:hypothetical protein
MASFLFLPTQMTWPSNPVLRNQWNVSSFYEFSSILFSPEHTNKMVNHYNKNVLKTFYTELYSTSPILKTKSRWPLFHFMNIQALSIISAYSLWTYINQTWMSVTYLQTFKFSWKSAYCSLSISQVAYHQSSRISRKSTWVSCAKRKYARESFSRV